MDNLTYKDKQFLPNCFNDSCLGHFVDNIFSSYRLFTICTNLFSRYTHLQDDDSDFLDEGKDYVRDYISDLDEMVENGRIEKNEVKDEKTRLLNLENDLTYISNIPQDAYNSLRGDCLEIITERYLIKEYSINKKEIHHEAKVYVNGVAKPNIDYSYNGTSSDFCFDKNNTFVMYECKANIASFIKRIQYKAEEATTSFVNISKSDVVAKIEQTIDEVKNKNLKKVFYLLYFKETIVNSVSNLIAADVLFTTFTSNFAYSQTTVHIKKVELEEITGFEGEIQVLPSIEMGESLFNM